MSRKNIFKILSKNLPDKFLVMRHNLYLKQYDKVLRGIGLEGTPYKETW